ncbi:MAG TPA: hypothetical protein DCX46_05225 [Bacteroidetes bacterium]|nr:MAG: hypothetical protein A2X68_02015 [Ignavibacteria bacterium GWC2_56_12]HAV22888.1 hypothetical protein [Bacteroidota bacterium]
MRQPAISDPTLWGLSADAGGTLRLNDVPLTSLAEEFGTPLHVVHEDRLLSFARRLQCTAEHEYTGPVAVHFAMKCNGVPGIVRLVREAGLRIEVMSELELHTAHRVGYAGCDIIVNGPCKSESFIRACLESHVRFIAVDSLAELDVLERLAAEMDLRPEVLLRVNPDIVPRGMNAGSATGSRSGCAFGLDLKGGEVRVALARFHRAPSLLFAGYHLHIGTGIRSPQEYLPAVRTLEMLLREARMLGFAPTTIDIGGGFASRTSREFTSLEMLKYQAFGRLPAPSAPSADPCEFIRFIAHAVHHAFAGERLPEVIFEPGRCVTGPHQFLLLKVHAVKHRPGAGTWAITDGGLGTVTMPTYYEAHDVLPCTGVSRPRSEHITILGPGCFAGDIVYRNLPMPSLAPGDVIALMDTGAYFTALESNFGHPRPAIVSVGRNGKTLLRRRETFDDTVCRDVMAIESHEVMS